MGSINEFLEEIDKYLKQISNKVYVEVKKVEECYSTGDRVICIPRGISLRFNPRNTVFFSNMYPSSEFYIELNGEDNTKYKVLKCLKSAYDIYGLETPDELLNEISGLESKLLIEN